MRKTVFAILLLAIMIGCFNDPYPVYNEGEVLWQVSDKTYTLSNAEMGPLITPDGQELVYINVYAEQPDQFKLMKRNLFTNQQFVIHSFGYAADISSDGQWLAFNSSYGAISKIKLNGDSLELITASGSGDFHPNWSLDGKSIIYEHHSGTSTNLEPSGIWKVAVAEKLKYFLVSAGGSPNLYFRDARVITIKYFGNSSGSKFLIHDLESGEQISLLDPSPGENNRHPQANLIDQTILFSNDESISLYDSNNVTKEIIPVKHFYESKKGDYLGFLASSPSWHPDGKHIVYQHFAITEYTTCPANMNCTYDEIFKGIVSIRKLKVRE